MIKNERNHTNASATVSEISGQQYKTNKCPRATHTGVRDTGNSKHSILRMGLLFLAVTECKATSYCSTKHDIELHVMKFTKPDEIETENGVWDSFYDRSFEHCHFLIFEDDAKNDTTSFSDALELRKKQLDHDMNRADGSVPGANKTLLRSILTRYNRLELYCRFHLEAAPLPAYQQKNMYALAILMGMFKNETINREDRILQLFIFYMFKLKESDEKHWEIQKGSETKGEKYQEAYFRPQPKDIAFALLKRLDNENAYTTVNERFKKELDKNPGLGVEMIQWRDMLFHDKPACRDQVLEVVFEKLLDGKDFNHVVHCLIARYISLIGVKQGTSGIKEHFKKKAVGRMMELDFTEVVKAVDGPARKVREEMEKRREELRRKRLKERLERRINATKIGDAVRTAGDTSLFDDKPETA